MDNDQPRRAMGARPKLPKLPNPSNEPKRAKKRAAREGQQPPVQQQPVQQALISAIPPFDANSRLTLDWTLIEGLIGPVIDQFGESCVSVTLCRLLQACHNRNKDVALHHKFSVKDLTDYVEKKTGKLAISNINVALDYIVDSGLLKEPEGRKVKATGKGYRIKGRFEVKRSVPKDDLYAILQNTTLAISLEATRDLQNLGVEEIYDVPLHPFFNPLEKSEVTDHVVLVVAKGETNTGKDFLVVQNSWGDTWCNQGYGRISLNPLGEFDIFWPVEVIK